MVVEESQDCSRAARGWVRSFFLVVFSYVSKAAVKIGRKVDEEDEEEAVGTSWDMGIVWGKSIWWNDLGRNCLEGHATC